MPPPSPPLPPNGSGGDGSKAYRCAAMGKDLRGTLLPGWPRKPPFSYQEPQDGASWCQGQCDAEPLCVGYTYRRDRMCRLMVTVLGFSAGSYNNSYESCIVVAQ